MTVNQRHKFVTIINFFRKFLGFFFAQLINDKKKNNIVLRIDYSSFLTHANIIMLNLNFYIYYIKNKHVIKYYYLLHKN